LGEKKSLSFGEAAVLDPKKKKRNTKKPNTKKKKKKTKTQRVQLSRTES